MDWIEYKKLIVESLDKFDFDPNILLVLEYARKTRKLIFLIGNGGSASIASHYACDLSKGANKEWESEKERFRAISLSEQISYLTAISNDASYSQIYRQQLINLAKPGDILIAISSSGNSPNIIEAVNYANSINMITIGICGFKGGKLKEISDLCAYLPADSYELSEDIHSIFGHFIAKWLREK